MIINFTLSKFLTLKNINVDSRLYVNIVSESNCMLMSWFKYQFTLSGEISKCNVSPITVFLSSRLHLRANFSLHNMHECQGRTVQVVTTRKNATIPQRVMYSFIWRKQSQINLQPTMCLLSVCWLQHSVYIYCQVYCSKLFFWIAWSLVRPQCINPRVANVRHVRTLNYKSGGIPRTPAATLPY